MAYFLYVGYDVNMTNDRITDIPRMQEFKRRLAELLTEFNASISPGFSGDTHGIDEEWVTFHVGNDHTSIEEGCIEGSTLEKTIGTEVQYIPPVKPPYVDPYTVFPVGTKVKYQERYLKSLHPGLWSVRLEQRGIVVPRSGSGLHPANKNYLYVVWEGDRKQGHTTNQIELAP